MRREVRARRLGRLGTEERVRAIFDDGTFEGAGVLGVAAVAEALAEDGFHAVVGRVHGRATLVLASDFRVARGTFGARVCAVMVDALACAAREGMPVVLLLDSDGVRLDEGEASVCGVASLLGALADVSGRVPIIAVVCAIASGAAAYAAALADFTIAVDRRAFAFLAGPSVVGAALGREPGLEALGGTRMHAANSGLVHALAADDGEALALARQLLGYLPPSADRLPPVAASSDAPRASDLGAALPAERSRAYDVHDVIARLVDEGSYLSLGARFGPAVQTGFARLAGRPIALVASQPRAMAGAIDADASQKLARFVRFAAAFNLPIVTLADTPGFLPGPASERARILVHGAKVISAYAEAKRSVPVVALVLRRAVGGGAVLALGAAVLLALPGYQMIGMGESAAHALTETHGEATPRLSGGGQAGARIVAPAEARAALRDAILAARPAIPAPEGDRKTRLVPL